MTTAAYLAARGTPFLVPLTQVPVSSLFQSARKFGVILDAPFSCHTSLTVHFMELSDDYVEVLNVWVRAIQVRGRGGAQQT